MLRIDNIRADVLSVPLSRPVVSSIHNIDHIGCIVVSVETNAGVTGQGVLFTLNSQFAALMQQMVLELGAFAVGEDAEDFEYIWTKIWSRIQFFGSGGFLIFGLSAIDMAIWDAIGKHQKRSMRQMLGGSRTSVPVYASDGLFLDRPLEELAAEAQAFVAQGYKAMKVRVSGRSHESDVQRVRTVREAVGDDITLMVDANQALDLNSAIALGRRLEEFNLAWLEEPIPAHQFEAYAALCAALDTPIATGESNYTRQEIKRLIDLQAADIIMPDLSRVGGITELRKVAALAEAAEISLSPHLYPEYSIGVVAGLPNATYIEQMSWFTPLFTEKAEFVDGMLAAPERPGFGFTVSDETIRKYSSK